MNSERQSFKYSVDINSYHYLDADDLSEFRKHYGTDDEDMLVAGSKTVNRLRKYLPRNEFERFQVILSALHYELLIPSARYLSTIALEIFMTYLIKERGDNDLITKISKYEFQLLANHLMVEEIDEYKQKREMAINKWPVYINDMRELNNKELEHNKGKND